jgi:hypothetical protein
VSDCLHCDINELVRARLERSEQGKRVPCATTAAPCDRLSLEPPPPLRLAGRRSWPGRRAGDRAPRVERLVVFGVGRDVRLRARLLLDWVKPQNRD